MKLYYSLFFLLCFTGFSTVFATDRDSLFIDKNEVQLSKFINEYSNENLLNDVINHDTPFATSTDLTISSEYFKGIYRNAKKYYKEPLNWDKKDRKKLYLTLGIAAALYSQDQNLQEKSQEVRDKNTDRLAKFAKSWGGVEQLGILTSWYFYGTLTKDRRVKTTSLIAFESALLASTATSVLKQLTGRQRPGDNVNYDNWQGPGNDNYSFPSGHATRAWAVSTVIASQYKHRKWVPIAMYTLATLSSWSRINDNAHWASDVFVGSALGFYSAKTILKYHNQEHNVKSSVNNFQIFPSIKKDGVQFSISFDF